MPELMFVLKSFFIALAITVFMQVKVGTTTIESQAEDWMRTSSLPLYLQSVSGGAVLAIKNASKATTDFVSKKLGHGGSAADGTQKASRLNLEFKRSKGAGGSSENARSNEKSSDYEAAE